MRTFLATHWKSIVALILLILLALLTMSPGTASAGRSTPKARSLPPPTVLLIRTDPQINYFC
jgi:hypothetical protein